MSKINLFERITAQIADAIAAGAADYAMPWHRASDPLHCPANAISGRAYRGLNVLTLWVEGEAKGYSLGQWATYRQWCEHGAQVRKGERGTTVFFWQQRPGDRPADSAEQEPRRPAFVAKAFTVFNAAQVEGFTPQTPPSLSEQEREARAERFVQHTGAAIAHGGDSAFYSPCTDRIHMPEFGRFRSAAAYYSVLAHELTHWSGSKHRLDRSLGNRFGSKAYAMEELIAELGAAFTCARLGIETEPRRDHAPYIASWLTVLRNDPRAIFAAASKAQEAADYLESLAIDPRGPRKACPTFQK